MKHLILAALTTINFFAPQVIFAQDHSHHSQHNMVLFGEDKLYASHIVYKEPHNYQVILKLDLESNLQAAINNEQRLYPNDTFILLLDSMDIGQIQSKPKISGQVFRRSSDEMKHLILEKLEIDPKKYSVTYFNELPLDLSSNKISNLLMLTQKTSPNCQCNRASIKCDDGGTYGYYCRCSDGREYWECR